MENNLYYTQLNLIDPPIRVFTATFLANDVVTVCNFINDRTIKLPINFFKNYFTPLGPILSKQVSKYDAT